VVGQGLSGRSPALHGRTGSKGCIPAICIALLRLSISEQGAQIERLSSNHRVGGDESGARLSSRMRPARLTWHPCAPWQPRDGGICSCRSDVIAYFQVLRALPTAVCSNPQPSQSLHRRDGGAQAHSCDRRCRCVLWDLQPDWVRVSGWTPMPPRDHHERALHAPLFMRPFRNCSLIRVLPALTHDMADGPLPSGVSLPPNHPRSPSATCRPDRLCHLPHDCPWRHAGA
jgi:hypothetical protein